MYITVIYLNVYRLPKPISFDWDRGNADKNWKKHGISQKESEEVFFNKPKILKDKKHLQIEIRLVAFGTTKKGGGLYIVFMIRNDKIRVISARRQSKKERNYYESKKS